MTTAAPSSTTAATATGSSARSRSTRLAIDGGTPVSPTTIPIVAVVLEESEIEAVTRVLRSGRLAQGAVVREFEERFAEATGARHAIATSNGTTALQVAYQPLLPADGSAIVPGWTFIATASMVRARPAMPLLADADETLYTIDLRSAAQQVRGDTRLIVPVHLYGNCVDIDGVEALAARHGLRVVYDAAQSHLATYRGRPLGAYGDAVTYSFYPTKNMTTGEGGMVTTNDDALAAEYRMVRDHGMRVRYLHETLGFNYRMTDVFAAVGLEQLARLPERTARRCAVARRYDELLAGVPSIVLPTVTPQATHVYHLYTLRLRLDRLTCDRDTFARALNAEGVGTAVHYPRPLNRQPVFLNDARMVCPPLPVAERLADEVLSIPVHHLLEPAQVEAVAEAIIKVADAYARPDA